MKEFSSCATPTVLFDNRVSSNPTVTQVGVDNDEGMNLAVSRLKELGNRKIGYLSSALGSYVYQQRYSAFFRALRPTIWRPGLSWRATPTAWPSAWTSTCPGCWTTAAPPSFAATP